MLESKYELLVGINTPADLKKLPLKKLPQLCNELREYIVEVISSNPGHLGASLGTVELTVALHYVFDTPNDKLIWDVGHQAYGHKILTNRKEKFDTIRKYKGLSGFPKMSESEYDAFGTGHSSTSISAALGMAIAAQISGDENRQHVAVIGDGSMTAGMAFEALNHAGDTDANLLVILNDNGISIDKSVGALERYLMQISTSKKYNKLKDRVWNFLSRSNRYGKATRNLIQQIDSGIKGSLLTGSNLFESFNFRYFGPADGHNVTALVKIFTDLKNIKGPKLLHLHTKKGKGLHFAEADQTTFHAPGKFDPATGRLENDSCSDNIPPKYQEVFGNTLLELARENKNIVGVTPAMASGSSMDIMMAEIPERVFDVGIAEQHAVTFSAGMASDGLSVYCNVYSSFLQRAYDQVIHDVALQKIPVIFCIDRSGLVGEDGSTHHGVFDISFLRPIPNLIIASPMDAHELRNIMFTAQNIKDLPMAIRYPRWRVNSCDWKNEMKEIEIGKAREIKKGEKIAIISYGPIGCDVVKATDKLAKESINPSHYDLRFVKPLDEDLLHTVCKNYSHIISIEDGVKKGGVGSAIVEFMSENGYTNKIKLLGIDDDFVEHGSLASLHKECGIDVDSIVETVKTFWND
ncbi:MAG: 1-deoxy-D-xylulose-5-phosphate synthase [Bacteroidales bacterium]|jgi:1-deoxy-D-xylulose-5-phosphate synthase|nr:1-deoxy-D-xylulose-5-phosphate synthase [Bacteroidales bacterium]